MQISIISDTTPRDSPVTKNNNKLVQPYRYVKTTIYSNINQMWVVVLTQSFEQYERCAKTSF